VSGGLTAADTAQALERALAETAGRIAAPRAPAGEAAEREAAELIERSLQLCREPPTAPVEPVRTVHHFACTGGTLISKCLAAMPNVQLLSEVDPLSTMRWNRVQPQFAPTDTVQQLRQSPRGVRPGLLVQLFAQNLRAIQAECSLLGQHLVLRDHAHSHFCVGASVPERPTLREMLPPDLPVLSVVTLRHPIDSYIALSGNGWIHHAPKTFDEYCRRYQAFLDRHEDVPKVLYEDFVDRPGPTMQALCELLQLPFRADFVQLFPAIRLTGDSGRGGEEIAARPRRRPPPALCAELLASREVGPLCARLGYAPSTLQAGLEPPPASTGDR